MAQAIEHRLRPEPGAGPALRNAGPDAAPTVVVRVRATLTRTLGNELVAEQVFESSVRAGDNRVGAIVGAYDKATAEVLQQLVAWTNARTAG